MKRWASVVVCVVACIRFILCLDGHIRSEKPDFIISDEETLEKLMSEGNYTIRTARRTANPHLP